jgi:hypothetical protein
MSEATILRSIRGAAKRRERADAAKRQATEDLRGFCQQARAAGLSRQGVYDLLGERPSA